MDILQTVDETSPAKATRALGEEGNTLTDIHGEPSFVLANKDVELYLTRRAGMLAPVRFRVGTRWVQPYALAPWQPHSGPEGIEASLPPLLHVLRGDFMCLPFGGGKGMQPHGDTANDPWDLVEDGPGRLVLEMQGKNPKCRVTKTLSIKEGQRAVYQEHRIEGLQGRYNLGHHAILLFPEKGGPYHVNVSPFKFGSVKPEAFSNPLAREYGALKTGARFSSLAKVPLANGGTTSLNEYPARQGFEDLVLMASKGGDFAWTAATLDGYVWISLKDPRTLPSTLFWISNGGRHAHPWEGRHLRRLGLEEVCGHYSDPLEIARQDRLKKYGIPTTLAFKAREAKSIRVIHLVHPVPKGFGMVKSVDRDPKGNAVIIKGAKGAPLRAPVDWSFLHG